MKEARFISRNKDKWKNMENGQQPDAEHLAANFIELSDDLAYARTFYPGSEVERYLNQLIAGYQTDINSRPVRKNKPIWYFWKQELPLLLASEYKTLLFAFFFFVLSAFVGVFSAAHDESFIRFEEREVGKYPNVTVEHIPLQCMHCEDAPCVHVCPTGASYIGEGGVVRVDESKCIGCGACRKICAHDAPTIENRKMHIDTNKCVGCGRCIAVCPMDAIEGVCDPDGHLLNCKMAEYAKAVVQGRPSFHISLAMDISPNCDCHPENDVPVIPNVGMFASFDPVALDEACAEMCSRMPRNPNASFEDISSDDLFHAVHTVTHWQDQTGHGEKIGLGSREYELIEI